MNRNKKPFTPNMRVAALYLLMGVLLFLAADHRGKLHIVLALLAV